MEQIIANFQSSGADLLVGVATPVAMRMQTATEDSQTPVVFAAVSDPIGAGLVRVAGSAGQQRDRDLGLSGYCRRHEY